MKRLAAVAIAAVALLAGASTAFASTGGAGIKTTTPQPGGYFNWTLTPGSVQTDSIQAYNPNTDTETFLVAAVNGISTPGAGITAAATGTPKTGSTAWTSLSDPLAVSEPNGDLLLTIPALSYQQVTFTVSEPLTAAVADYNTFLLVQGAKQCPSGQGEFGFCTVSQAAVRLLVSVPGPSVVSSTVGQITYGTAGPFYVLNVPVTNTGNRDLPAITRTFTVTACTGQTLAVVSGSFPAMTPGSTIALNIISGQLTGCYTVK